MVRLTRVALLGLIASLGCFSIAGCGRGSSNDLPAPSNNAASSTDAVTRAAADFLDAVLKGDTQRASARLTPTAIERIIASGGQFAPPGLETATFRIGDVRALAPEQALVQCVLTDNSPADGPQSEEMCCLMRLVDGDWRVSGIAFGTSPDQPWTLADFETGQNIAIPRHPSSPGATAPAVPSDGRPSPRTAQEPPQPLR